MKQLLGILVAICTTLIILVVLIISGLRVVLLHLDFFRPQLIFLLNYIFDTKIKIYQVHGFWRFFYPVLDIKGLNFIKTKKNIYIQRTILTLDIWRSLLYRRWLFYNVNISGLQLEFYIPSFKENNYINDRIFFNYVSNFFLYQFKVLTINKSQIIFLTKSNKKVNLLIIHFICFNNQNIHRAKGIINLSHSLLSKNIIDVYFNLHNQSTLINKGLIYLQVKNIIIDPWLNQLLQNSTKLVRAFCNLKTWITINNNTITKIDTSLKHGKVLWQKDRLNIDFDIKSLILHLKKYNDIWRLDIPILNIFVNKKSLAPASFFLCWLSGKNNFFIPEFNSKIHIHVTNLNLKKIFFLAPIFSNKLSMFYRKYQNFRIYGIASILTLDIPIDNPSFVKFQVKWNNVSWYSWKRFPGVSGVSGIINGTLTAGKIQIIFKKSTLYFNNKNILLVPLLITKGNVIINWYYDNRDGLILLSKKNNIKIEELQIKGDFYFNRSIQGESWLDIFANLHLNNVDKFWCYLKLLNIKLTEYLMLSLKHIYIKNGVLLFSGNPNKFPFKNKKGHFEIYIPLRKVNYCFAFNWPKLFKISVDINLINKSLFMYSSQIIYNNIFCKNIIVYIPDYLKNHLFIDMKIIGLGNTIYNFCFQTPLKNTLGKTLSELQLNGLIKSKLHLYIPLNNQSIIVFGKVKLNSNSLYIKQLKIELKQLNGNFYFYNGNLKSNRIQAQWLGQLITVYFNTIEKKNKLDINLALNGNYIYKKRFKKKSIESVRLNNKYISWKSNITINLFSSKNFQYNILIKGYLNNINNFFSLFLNKKIKQYIIIKINIKGNMQSFFLSGHFGDLNSFNSQWLLSPKISFVRGSWVAVGTIPILPANNKLILSTVSLDNKRLFLLLKFFIFLESKKEGNFFNFSDSFTLVISKIKLGDQFWHNLIIKYDKLMNNNRFIINGKEINGILIIPNHSVLWYIKVNYLYYKSLNFNVKKKYDMFFLKNMLNNNYFLINKFVLYFNIHNFLIRKYFFDYIGLYINKIKNKIMLTNVFFDIKNIQVILNSFWLYVKKNQTFLKGKIIGDKISTIANFFGIDIPLINTPFNINYNIYWNNVPWELNFIDNLNAVFNIELGKGRIENISSGNINRILRLINFETLLRKLQLDFSGTFDKGVYFNSIKGNFILKNSLLRTDNLLINGLEVDIGVTGNIDFDSQNIDIHIIIAPEISSMFGAATALITHPTAGAAVFAASKVLTPLWDKYSFIRYRIIGNLAKPKICEILRQPHF